MVLLRWPPLVALLGLGSLVSSSPAAVSNAVGKAAGRSAHSSGGAAAADAARGKAASVSVSQRQSSCPCADASLCDPVSAEHDREVLGWGAGTRADWSSYDFTSLTIIAHDDGHDPDFICMAHSHSTRVLIGAKMNMSQMLNATARTQWINESIAEVQTLHLDGLYFDYELPSVISVIFDGRI